MSEDGQVVDTTEVEKEARMQGWVPKEDFRGKETDWKSAEDFVAFGRQVNPLLRKNNERLVSELEKTKADMAELRLAAEDFKKFQKAQFERKEQDLKTELARLKQEKADAVSAGDGQRVTDIDDRQEEIRDEIAKAKAEATVVEKPVEKPQAKSTVLVEWETQNEWYGSDPFMAETTNRLAENVARRNPTLKDQAFLDELDKALEETFTMEKLGRTKRPRSPVEGNSKHGAPAKAGDKSYDKLPADAKAACDRFVKQKLMTREQYIAEYDWS